MQTFNVFGTHEWEVEGERERYRHRRTAIGKLLDAKDIGVTLYELPPGEATWPYHYELGCEEWCVVVEGRPTLRTPDGERELEPWDAVVFPEGPSGAHALSNGTDGTVRLLLASSKSPLAVVHYPDSGKVGIWSQERGYESILRTEPNLDYWQGE